MINALPLQPHDDEGPVFSEPWEAQAFALVIALNQGGLFSWQEWAAILSEEISRAQKQGDLDLGDTYYQHWLRALEKIAEAKGISNFNEISARADEWRSAYHNTPNGKPIQLAASTV